MQIREQEMTNPEQDRWNRQHRQRFENGPEGDSLLFEPSPTAVQLAKVLSPHSRVLEVGCANGRDARYWALTFGHMIDGIDFSEEAIRQLALIAKKQGLGHLVTGHIHDVSNGSLPNTLPSGRVYNAFYARSALTLADEQLGTLMKQVTQKVKRGGIIMIEGRDTRDPKIARSRIEENMAIDLDGHKRRVYTEESMLSLAELNGWKVESMQHQIEYGFETPLYMLRFVARCCE